MKIDDFKLILTIKEAGSFLQASEYLFLSPSAVNTSIARIEEELGVRLFNRGPGKSDTHLTPQGKIVADYALEFLNQYDEMQTRLAYFTKDTIKIGIPDSYFRRFVNVINSDDYDHKKISIVTDSCENLETLLQDELIDIIVTFSCNSSIAFPSLPVIDRNIGILLSPTSKFLSTSREEELSLDAIAEEPLAIPSLKTRFGTMIRKAFTEKHITPQQLYTAYSETDRFVYAHNNSINTFCSEEAAQQGIYKRFRRISDPELIQHWVLLYNPTVIDRTEAEDLCRRLSDSM